MDTQTSYNLNIFLNIFRDPPPPKFSTNATFGYVRPFVHDPGIFLHQIYPAQTSLRENFTLFSQYGRLS